MGSQQFINQGLPQNSTNSLPASIPASVIDTDIFAQAGLRIVAEVARRILSLVEANQIEPEEVVIPARSEIITGRKLVVQMNAAGVSQQWRATEHIQSFEELRRHKTNADRLAQEWIEQELGQVFSEMPIVCERTRVNGTAGPGKIAPGQVYAVVDPIDGTIHLDQSDTQWLIKVAFCIAGKAIVGISAIPSEGKIYVGELGKSSRVFDLDINLLETLPTLSAVSSDRKLRIGIFSSLDIGGHADLCGMLFANLNDAEIVPNIGSAYSYLEVARGNIDAIIFPGGNFAWDHASDDVVLQGVGAGVYQIPWEAVFKANSIDFRDRSFVSNATSQALNIRDLGSDTFDLLRRTTQPPYTEASDLSCRVLRINSSQVQPCEYSPDLGIKDSGHIVMRNGLSLNLPCRMRCWSPTVR